MIAPWLRRHLETIGAWNADGISRRASARRCADCGAWTLAGLDDPRCAGAAVVDTTPLNTLGEAVALLAGRTTYTLSRRAGRLELDHRHQWAIGAGTPDGDVVAEHRCHASDVPALAAASRLRPATAAQEVADDPPF